MGKYIELKALFKTVEDYASTHPVMRDDELFALFCSVDAADVRPVVRGKWIKINGLTACSVCKENPPRTYHNFCPNCGADMREEEE